MITARLHNEPPDVSDDTRPTQHDLLLTRLAVIRGGWLTAGGPNELAPGGLNESVAVEGAARSLVQFIRGPVISHARIEETVDAALHGHPQKADGTISGAQQEHDEILLLADELEHAAATGGEGHDCAGALRLLFALEALTRQHLVREAGRCVNTNLAGQLLRLLGRAGVSLDLSAPRGPFAATHASAISPPCASTPGLSEPLDEWLAGTFPASDPLPGPGSISGCRPPYVTHSQAGTLPTSLAPSTGPHGVETTLTLRYRAPKGSRPLPSGPPPTALELGW